VLLNNTNSNVEAEYRHAVSAQNVFRKSIDLSLNSNSTYSLRSDQSQWRGSLESRTLYYTAEWLPWFFILFFYWPTYRDLSVALGQSHIMFNIFTCRRLKLLRCIYYYNYILGSTCHDWIFRWCVGRRWGETVDRRLKRYDKPPKKVRIKIVWLMKITAYSSYLSI